jgi:hypothetical protein
LHIQNKKSTMKKGLILFLAASALTLGACKKKGCMDTSAVNYNAEAKKDNETCQYKPIITLNGASTVTVTLGSTYEDAGATAKNKDGSAVTVTANTSAVNTNQTGTYTVTYTATNDNGTTTATRTVNVVVGQENWLVTWNAISDCSGTQFPISGTPTITANGATGLNIENFFSLVGGTVTATINGSTITIPEQTINVTVGDVILSGTGTMNATGTQFQVTYTYENTTPFIGGSGSCLAIYNKQ